MKNKIQFGVFTSQILPWEKEVERWRLIESLGFDSIWLGDHFTDPVNNTGHWFESWTLLASLAVVTEKVRLGALVTSMPLRRPAVLARQALTVDHISNGRLEIGLGTGGRGDPVHHMLGIEDWVGSERVDRFKDQVEIIDRLLRQDVSSYNGKFYKLNEATMNPPTIQKPRPPIVIAAMRKGMLKVAAKYADTWNSFGSEDWRAPAEKIFENTKKRVELIDKYCKELNRNPDTLRRSLMFYTRHGRAILDTEESFRFVIKKYKEIGIDEFIIYFPFFEPKNIQNLKNIAENVIPDLR
ncbi:MAG: LLM class flavin-dependent oxidoreductase [Promethearchaeota archaeon]|jgi:alkanesulfonate monooxygenase SsuD/methylene tetrahydromethanopterin reductase-like flavin-dependent oxidoreductase (luciferase family)